MSKLKQELRSIFEDCHKDYLVIVEKRIDELFIIISKALKEGVADTSNGLVCAFTYELIQQPDNQIIQPFELITEGLEERFDDTGLCVELKVSYLEDGQREAKFTFTGWTQK